MIRHSHRARRLPMILVALAIVGGILPARAHAEGIRIIRDGYGVPHIYGQTAPDVSYGAGYALAQDRLWQMHVFTLVAHGRLSHLLGDLVAESDREVRFWTYTTPERARRFETYPANIKENIHAFVAGINAWIAEVRLDPTKLPVEYLEFAEPLDDWTVDDSVAMSDYLIYTFGAGGGNELRNLLDLKAYEAKFGEEEGRKKFDDLVWVNDPDAPSSIPADFLWRNSPSHARAEADLKTLEPDARISTPEIDRVVGPASPMSGGVSVLDALKIGPSVEVQLAAHERAQEQMRKLYPHFGSNAQIVSGERTTTGNTALSAGPQVGHFVPEALADFGLHAADGSLEATGMTFAGAGPAVLIGRGNGFNWTTTTGDSDIADTYVETLNPADHRQYLFNDNWERMECRTESYTQKGVEFATQEICRTRHGPVLAFDEANLRAYSVRYGWFNREGGTVAGFFGYNNVRSLEDFATNANLLASNHNMFYADDQGNIGYWHPGNFPRRPAGDLRFPYDGTGSQEWLGLLSANEVPHAVNLPRGWLANWNNKPAADWDRESGWGAFHDVVDFFDNLDENGPVRPDPFGGSVNPDRDVSWEDLNANLRYAAFRDDNADFFQRYLPTDGANATEDAALEVMNTYKGFIYDGNDDGKVDSSGYTILRRFSDRLRSSVFNDDLAGVPGRAGQSALVHVMNPDAALAPKFDFLNGMTPPSQAAMVFSQAVAELAAEYDSDDPNTWRSEQPMTHYQRLNELLLADVGRGIVYDELRANTGIDAEVLKPGALPIPGDPADTQEMDRGTYNHLVLYLNEPSGVGLGNSAVEAGSVISPGQNGFIGLLGEGPHSRDQLPLYNEWRYKPMPMSLAETLAVAESQIELDR